jgi:Inositol 1,3,4-trisphosphate 5/6-kinase ATP-grasp domain
MAAFIRTQLGLSLFGFDVITNVSTGKHGCIDVNYFPGMSGRVEMSGEGVSGLFYLSLSFFRLCWCSRCVSRFPYTF